MTVAVLVPFCGGNPHRERNWSWVRSKYEQDGFEVVVGTTDAPGFSRTQAILNAREQSDADVFVIGDADVWPEGLDDGIAEAEVAGWAVPNWFIHRLSEASTWRVYGGEPWRGLELSQDNPQDTRPYPVHEGGTCLVVTAEAFDTAPPDPRFVGWGQEDDAWALALHSLVGKPWRGVADLVHLWHPAEPRKSRVLGNEANRRLLGRYLACRRRPDLINEVIEEGRAWLPSTSAPTDTA
jgi:hypothetical protein